jgi:hypothetical protein
MGFNRRKLEDERRHAAEKEAAARRATDAQVLEDAERLIAIRPQSDCELPESSEFLILMCGRRWNPLLPRIESWSDRFTR